MVEFFRYPLDHGVRAFLHRNQAMTNPPLSITEEQQPEGLAMIDEALEIGDRA